MRLNPGSSARKLYRYIRKIAFPPLHLPNYTVPYDYFGSEYGGWPVLVNSLTSDSRVYSFGVGDDISFDLAVMSRYNCQVNAFDPTPRCIDWIESAGTPPMFRFFPVGLSNRSQTLRFSAPTIGSHVSYTVAVSDSVTDVVELPVRAIDEIMSSLGDHKIDLLKMDIEGSEYDVLPDMIGKGVFPSQLCVEFHHRMYGYTNAQTLRAVESMMSAGYKLYFVSESGREYGFCR